MTGNLGSPAGTRCNYCGSMDEIDMDHIISLDAGGYDIPANIQWLCKTCNRAKSNKMPFINEPVPGRVWPPYVPGLGWVGRHDGGAAAEAVYEKTGIIGPGIRTKKMWDLAMSISQKARGSMTAEELGDAVLAELRDVMPTHTMYQPGGPRRRWFVNIMARIVEIHDPAYQSKEWAGIWKQG